MSFWPIDHVSLYEPDPELEARAEKVALFLEHEVESDILIERVLKVEVQLKTAVEGTWSAIGTVMGAAPIPPAGQSLDAMMGKVQMSNPHQGKTPDQAKPIFPTRAMRSPLDWKPPR